MNDAWETCVLEQDPHRDHWNHKAHGFERLCAKIEEGDWVVVLDKSWPPLAPAYAQVNGQWQLTQHIAQPRLRQRLESQIQTIERQQREQEVLQSRNQPSSAEVQTLPASGPGNRVASLGPHAGKEGASNNTSAPVDYNSGQQLQIEQALKDQRAMLGAKKTELTTWDDPAKANFKKSFGTTDEPARRLIQQRIDTMLAANGNMTIANFKSAEPDQLKIFGPGLFAYVRPNDPTNTIFLGPKFWTAPDTGLDSKAGTLAHEMSHFTNIGGTKDNFPAQGYRQPVYGVGASRQLAQDNSDLALRHADSFQYYLENAK